jgi:hypothetical protein
MPPRKKCPVDVKRRALGSTTNDDPVVLLVPLQNRPRPNAELLANLGGHRYLTLRGDL